LDAHAQRSSKEEEYSVRNDGHPLPIYAELLVYISIHKLHILKCTIGRGLGSAAIAADPKKTIFYFSLILDDGRKWHWQEIAFWWEILEGAEQKLGG